MCFFPRQQDLPGAEMVSVPGATLACYRVHVDDELPTLLYFHGNGEVVGDYVPEMANLLASVGVNVFLAEYRGYGGSTGRPALATMLDDVPYLIDAAAGEVSKLIVFGRSIGSLYAVEAVARRPEIGGLVLESAIADPLDLFSRYVPLEQLGAMGDLLREEVHECFNQQQKLVHYANEVLLMHTEDDEIVPVRHSHSLHQWASHAHRRLLIFPSGGHNGILLQNRDSYLAALAELAREVDGS